MGEVIYPLPLSVISIHFKVPLAKVVTPATAAVPPPPLKEIVSLFEYNVPPLLIIIVSTLMAFKIITPVQMVDLMRDVMPIQIVQMIEIIIQHIIVLMQGLQDLKPEREPTTIEYLTNQIRTFLRI